MRSSFLTLSTGLVLLIASSTAFANESKKLNKLLDDIWEWEMANSPILATRLNHPQESPKLEDLSPESLKHQHAEGLQFMAKLQKIRSKRLTTSEEISLSVQKLRLQNQLDQYRYNAHYMPFTSESGFYSMLAFLPGIHKFNSRADYEFYLDRLADFPRYFNEQTHWLRQGIKSGKTQPLEVIDIVPELVKNFVYENPTESPFYRPFAKESVAFLSDEQWRALQTEGQHIISNKVVVSYQKLHDFLLNEYLPEAKEELGAISWPNGEEYYKNRAAYYTTTSLTVDEIHNLGLSEVKRIKGEMQEVIDALNYEGDLAQFIQFLRTDPQFYAKTEGEILQYAAYLSKRMDAKLPKLFSYLPRTPYGVAPVPASIAPNYTTGRYISPTNDTEPGYYWVNTYALDKRPLYALPALTLHEAVPGHHLQIALAQELSDLPNVRRYTYISAFGEGWGLYSEYLGKEVDFYETPYDEFGRLSYEMWRATRLVVDTGVHTKGWTRQQAVDYMLDNTALSEHNVRTEVDRYITWPAQALSYKIGELTIKRLRKEAEETLKGEFDIREFHKAVLEHGSVPLTTLENSIRTFINK